MNNAVIPLLVFFWCCRICQECKNDSKVGKWKELLLNAVDMKPCVIVTVLKVREKKYWQDKLLSKFFKLLHIRDNFLRRHHFCPPPYCISLLSTFNENL
jgi:hypothetical protein